MKGVNLKSPAGYGRSIQKTASLTIQCSLCTDREVPGRSEEMELDLKL